MRERERQIKKRERELANKETGRRRESKKETKKERMTKKTQTKRSTNKDTVTEKDRQINKERERINLTWVKQLRLLLGSNSVVLWPVQRTF
jgi:hypothetical protein